MKQENCFLLSYYRRKKKKRTQKVGGKLVFSGIIIGVNRQTTLIIFYLEKNNQTKLFKEVHFPCIHIVIC